MIFRASILSILFIALLQGRGEAQNPYQNLDSLSMQYWFLRERMVNDFMLGVGPEQGQSILGYRRGYDHSLKFGDNTIKLGHYISILATEYALLQRTGQNLQRTSKELFYALYAVNRLDLAAETYYEGPDGMPGAPKLNGFMLRDDVSSVTPEQLLKLNTDTGLIRVERVVSDYLEKARGPFVNTPSQDQVIYLLSGLSLVVKLIPDSVVYRDLGLVHSFQDGETSFHDEAVRIIERLVSYMYNPPWSWDLVNPVTGAKIPSKNGGSALALSWGYAQAMEQWTGSALRGVGEQSVMYRKLFDLFKNPTVYHRIQRSGEGDKVLMLAAMTRAWGDDSFESILSLSKDKKDVYEFDNIPLLFQILYPDDITGRWNIDRERQRYHDLLIRLPCGTGPYHHGTKDGKAYPDVEWSANDRIVEPEQRGFSGRAHWYGDFSGFDWMLYHNLYRLVFQDMHGFVQPNLVGQRIVPKDDISALEVSNSSVLNRTLVNEGFLLLNGGPSDTLWVESGCSSYASSIICYNGSTTIVSGLTIIFKPGTVLRIDDEASLIVADGATVVFQPGSVKQITQTGVLIVLESSKIIEPEDH